MIVAAGVWVDEDHESARGLDLASNHGGTFEDISAWAFSTMEAADIPGWLSFHPSDHTPRRVPAVRPRPHQTSDRIKPELEDVHILQPTAHLNYERGPLAPRRPAVPFQIDIEASGLDVYPVMLPVPGHDEGPGPARQPRREQPWEAPDPSTAALSHDPPEYSDGRPSPPLFMDRQLAVETPEQLPVDVDVMASLREETIPFVRWRPVRTDTPADPSLYDVVLVMAEFHPAIVESARCPRRPGNTVSRGQDHPEERLETFGVMEIVFSSLSATIHPASPMPRPRTAPAAEGEAGFFTPVWPSSDALHLGAVLYTQDVFPSPPPPPAREETGKDATNHVPFDAGAMTLDVTDVRPLLPLPVSVPHSQTDDTLFLSSGAVTISGPYYVIAADLFSGGAEAGGLEEV